MQPGPYGAPPVAPHPVTEPLKPNGWWYVVAAGLAIGGTVIAIVIGVRAAMTYSDRIDDFERVDVPGTDTVLLESGGHTIYHEYSGAGDDFGFTPSVSVSVAAPDGSAVELDDYTGSFTYGTTDHEGEALFTFDAEEPGDYTVSVEGESGSEIAVGRGLGSGLFAGIAGAMVAGFGGVVAGIIVAIVVAVKRSGARTRRQLALVRSGWAPPGSPGAWPAGPQPPGTGMPPSTWTPPARPQYPTPGQYPSGGQPGQPGSYPSGGQPGQPGQYPSGGQPGQPGQYRSGGQPGQPGQYRSGGQPQAPAPEPGQYPSPGGQPPSGGYPSPGQPPAQAPEPGQYPSPGGQAPQPPTPAPPASEQPTQPVPPDPPSEQPPAPLT